MLGSTDKGVILAGVPCGHYKQSGLSTKNVCVLCFCVVFLGFCVFVCCVCFCSWFLRRKAPLFFFCLSAPFPFSPLIFTFFSFCCCPPGSISQLTFPSSFSRFFCNTEQHSSHINKRPPSDPQASQPYASCRHPHHQCSQKATSPQVLVAFQNLVL